MSQPWWSKIDIKHINCRCVIKGNHAHLSGISGSEFLTYLEICTLNERIFFKARNFVKGSTNGKN